VAMEQGNFAAGRRADQSSVRVNAQQLAEAPVLPHPLVTPQKSMVAGSPTRAVPTQMQRPVLASHEDTAVRAGSTAPSRGNPMSEQPAPVTRNPTTPEGGRQGALPTGLTQQSTGAGASGSDDAVRRRPYVQEPAEQQAPAQTPPQRPGPGTSYRQPIQQQTEPQPQQQAPVATQPQRPLFNRAVPPEPRPSFDQQRQAIETTDPGRPLSPQQLNNIRQNQPAGQPQQHEAPHPAPAPAARPAPPQRSAPPPPNKH